MSKQVSWLTTFAFIASVMPIVLMAFIIKLLPPEVPIVELDPSAGFTSKYNNLMVILFSIVPLCIVILTRFVKRRDEQARTLPMLLVAIVIGIIFSAIALYGGIAQIKKVVLDAKFDYIGFLAVIFSFVLAVLSNVLRYGKEGQFFSINNKFSRSSKECWDKVHSVASEAQLVTFVAVAMVLAFIKGWSSIIVLLSTMIVFSLWAYCYSYMVYKKLERIVEIKY